MRKKAVKEKKENINKTVLNGFLDYFSVFKHLRVGRQLRVFRDIFLFTTREFSQKFPVFSPGEISFIERGERLFSDTHLLPFVSSFFPEFVSMLGLPENYVEELSKNFTKMYYFESFLRSIESLKSNKVIPLSLRFAVYHYFVFMYEVDEEIPLFIRLFSLLFMDKIELKDLVVYLTKNNKYSNTFLFEPLWEAVDRKDFAYQMSFPVLCDFLSLLTFEFDFNFYNEITTVYFYDYVIDANEFKGLAFGVNWKDFQKEIVAPPPPER